MIRSLGLALAAALALTGCAPAGDESSRGAAADCVALFQRYDFLDRTASQGRRDRWSVPPDLMWQANLLRRADCITLTRNLETMQTVPAAPMPGGGAAIAPTSLHAGVVTNRADDARAIAFFGERGMMARSVGKPGLGRRVYVGPFATEEGLAAARDQAHAAGFVAPYPVRYW